MKYLSLVIILGLLFNQAIAGVKKEVDDNPTIKNCKLRWLEQSPYWYLSEVHYLEDSNLNKHFCPKSVYFYLYDSVRGGGVIKLTEEQTAYLTQSDIVYTSDFEAKCIYKFEALNERNMDKFQQKTNDNEVVSQVEGFLICDSTDNLKATSKVKEKGKGKTGSRY